eukprot:COSAG01_NODE_1264_length_10990_cov_35.511615_13_plen_152_part_00
MWSVKAPSNPVLGTGSSAAPHACRRPPSVGASAATTQMSTAPDLVHVTVHAGGGGGGGSAFVASSPPTGYLARPTVVATTAVATHSGGSGGRHESSAGGLKITQQPAKHSVEIRIPTDRDSPQDCGGLFEQQQQRELYQRCVDCDVAVLVA